MFEVRWKKGDSHRMHPVSEAHENLKKLKLEQLNSAYQEARSVTLKLQAQLSSVTLMIITFYKRKGTRAESLLRYVEYRLEQWLQ